MKTEKNNQRAVVGRVVSDKNQKTIVVEVESLIRHLKYGKYIKRTSKRHVHDPENRAQVGDLVSIKQVRPISKNKTWELLEIIESNQL